MSYIDEQGVEWDSRTEHDLAICSSRYSEAFIKFNRSGGVLGEPPNPIEFIERFVCDEDDYQQALEEIIESLVFYAMFHDRRAHQAQFN